MKYEAWKRYPFRGEPPRGHCKECPPPPSLPIPYLYLQESVLKCVKAGFSLAAESCEHLWPSAEAWCFCLVKINKTKDVSRVRSSTESERNNQLSLFCRLCLSRETLSLTIWWKPGFRSRKQTRKNTSQSQSLPYRSSVIGRERRLGLAFAASHSESVAIFHFWFCHLFCPSRSQLADYRLVMGSWSKIAFFTK